MKLISKIFVALSALIFSISACESTANIYEYDFFENYQLGGAALDADGISELNISWIAGDITFESREDGKITFSEEGAYDTDSTLRYYIDGGTLRIHYCRSGLNLSLAQLKGKSLTVYIPKELARLTINNVSANMKLSGAALNELSINSVSGTLNADSLTTEKISIDNVSGRLTFDTTTAKKVKLKTVSGNLTFNGSADNFDVSGVSSDLKLISNVCPSEIDVNTVSGSAVIFIPDDSGFTANFQTVSGKLNSEFNVTLDGKRITCGNGGADFAFETVSGNVGISKLTAFEK